MCDRCNPVLRNSILLPVTQIRSVFARLEVKIDQRPLASGVLERFESKAGATSVVGSAGETFTLQEKSASCY